MFKILYVCRLFNGLEKSVLEEKWKPTGVPTIYRMIDKLNASETNLKLILTAKDGFSEVNINQNKEIQFDGFSNTVTVLKNHALIHKKTWRKIWRETIHLLQIYKHTIIHRPDIIYFDHGNIWAAGIFSRFSNLPVILRVMGVYPSMREAVLTQKPNFFQIILRWCYRAPYALVICTQDGSGVEKWSEQALRINVPVSILLNGIPEQKVSKKILIKKKKINITFLGKLETAKGAYKFVEAMLKVVEHSPENFQITIVGTGSLESKIKKEISSSKFNSCFRIIKRIENKSVINLLLDTDIYVSLNKYGNLSNANLEAISAGCCIIIPKSHHDKGVDVATDKLLNNSTVFRLENSEDSEELAKIVLELSSNDERRLEMSRKTLECSKLLLNWNERIENEFVKLKQICLHSK